MSNRDVNLSGIANSAINVGGGLSLEVSLITLLSVGWRARKKKKMTYYVL